ncbi:MAG: hypothetical protein WDO73_19785 [Ignavibacteriota bacterium]
MVAGGNNVSVLLGKGDGTFQAALRYTPGWSVSALARPVTSTAMEDLTLLPAAVPAAG